MAKLTTRLFQRAPHQPWIPLRAQRLFQDGAARITRLPPDVSVSSEHLDGIRCDRIVGEAAPPDANMPPRHRPDVPCETQDPPNLHAPGGDATLYGGGP